MSIDGMITTDLQTVGVKIDMDEAIVLLNTWDVPLQKRLSSAPTSSTRIDWLEDTLDADTVTVSSVAGTTSPWTLTIPSTTWIRAGDLFRNRTLAYDKQLKVDSVTNATTIVVSSAGNNADTDDPVAADVLEHIGQLLAEGGDPGAARAVDRTNPYNYTQIGQEAVTVSRTERKRATYGVADEYTYQAQKKFKELAIRTERSLTQGVRYQSGNKRFMGGLLSYITTNSRSGVVANSKSLLNSLIKDCYTTGGAPTSLYVSPAVKAAISANVDPTLRRTTVEATGAGYVVDSFQSDFGHIEIFADRHVPATKGILVQEEFVTRRVFDGYFHEMLAKTGDGDKGEIVGEFSLEVKNQSAQGVLTLTDA